jgi:uncharacterized protein YbcI
VEATSTDERGHLTGGRLHEAIANAAVGVHRRYAGRGPTKAHAFTRGRYVVLVMADAMTTTEQTLVAHGNSEAVSALRRELHQTMRNELVRAVEGLTGSHVVAFMSDNHANPDLIAELYVLDREVSARA